MGTIQEKIITINVPRTMHVLRERCCTKGCPRKSVTNAFDTEIIMNMGDTLEDSLQDYFSSSLLTCKLEGCKCEKDFIVKETTLIEELPENLILMLRRYDDPKNKITKSCDVPAFIDLTQYCSEFFFVCQEDELNSDFCNFFNAAGNAIRNSLSTIYQVKSIISHRGPTLNSGHYIEHTRIG